MRTTKFFFNFFGANLKLDQIRKFLFWKETYLILLFVTQFLLITRNTIKRDISIVVHNKQKKTFFIVGRKKLIPNSSLITSKNTI